MNAFIARTPFDWRTPYGYSGAYLLALPVIYFLVRFATCSITFTGASCGIMTAFSVDIRENLAAINIENDMKTSDAKLMASVCEVVKFHSNTKQLSFD